MNREWKVQLSRSTFSLALEFVYSSIVEGFFAAMGLGALVVLVLNLLGNAPQGSVIEWPAWRLGLMLLFVAAVTTVPVRGLVRTFRDALLTRVTLEGPATDVEETHIEGKNGGYGAIRFKVGGESLRVARVDLPAGARSLIANHDVKVECRAASREVVRLWTRPHS